MKKLSRIGVYSFLFFTIIIIDRITKWWALNNLCTPHELFPCVSLDLMLNRGIAWGFFHTAPNAIFWLLTSINALIIVGVAWHATYCALTNKTIVGHILIIAGALANMIDRFMYHGVIDFILLSYKNVSFPVFNIADVCIVIGVGILFFTNYDDK